MSSAVRVKTTSEDEEIIQSVREAFAGRNYTNIGLDKWYVLRLALMFSLSQDGDPLDLPVGSKSSGSDYRLAQLTGEGKGGDDFTDLFRAILSVRHGVDLFDRVHGDQYFQDWLERHIHRGLTEIKRRRRDEDIIEFMLQEFTALVGTSEVEHKAAPPLASKADEDILAGLRELGIRGEIRETVQGPRLTMYRVHLPVLNHFDLLANGLEKLAISLGLARQGLSLRHSTEPKEVELYVPRPPETWRHLQANDLRHWATAPTNDDLPVLPGLDALGKPFQFDLAKAPHLFVAGTTGSGKSVCLHALLCSLILARKPEEVRLCLIDTKKTELSAYRNAAHLWGERVHVTKDEATVALNHLIHEMERRQTELGKLGVRDIQGARGRVAGQMPRIVVVVEELADLTMGKESGEVEELLIRIAQLGRASGIHLVLSTQRPDSETFSGLLRSNIPSRIALAVQKATESKIILDDLGAERLLKPGDMLVRLSGRDPERVHGILLSAEDVSRIVQQTEK